jgi:uncharacterized BrkB/YihY/UPF0761 family membrane protein
MFYLLLTLLGLWGSTLTIVAVDRKMRLGRPDAAPSFNEPSWGGIIAFTLLLNIVALPYYFGKSRRSALWGFIGFGAFLGCFLVSILGGIIGRILDVVMHTR